MTTHFIAHFLGRLIASYLLVWLICFGISRFNWRKAFRLSTRWYNLLIVILLTVLGVGIAIVRRGSLI